MAGWLYASLLIACFAFVLVRGDWELRVASLLIVATSIVTLVNFKMGGTFAELQPWLIVSETVALTFVLFIAYRSRRFWPLCFAATQIATVLSVLAPLFGRGLVSYALGIAQGVWAYPQILILILATVRGRHLIRRTESRKAH